MRSLLSLIVLVGVLVAPRPVVGQSVHYKVIINANNPATVLMASELSRIYLGTAQVWPDRTFVQAIDQKSGSLRDAFLREIVGKDSVSLSRYWEQAIFSGKGVPPRALTNDVEIVEFVRKTPGAIGYVDAATSLGPDIKVLRIVR